MSINNIFQTSIKSSGSSCTITNQGNPETTIIYLSFIRHLQRVYVVTKVIVLTLVGITHVDAVIYDSFT